MLLSIIKYFKGYVYVRLSGYAPERFLNLCGSHDILIWNLKSTEDGYSFYISVAGFKQLRPILKKTKTRIRIQKKYGIPFKLYHYRKRKMFALGMLLFAGLIYYLSGFIWNIEVNGNSYLSEEVVLCFLSGEHASFGAKKKDIDCAVLEETLRSRYPEVIWTSIKIYGTKMTVDIQENLLPEETYEDNPEKPAHDIIAADDGEITEMITRSGTPVVTVGTKVKKGDVLVNGCIEILNDDGEVAKYLYRTADADVTAKVTYPYHDEIPVTYVEKKPTGAKKITYQIRMLDYLVKIPFFSPMEEPYEVVSDVSQFHFTDNFYLPVYLVRQTYSGYENRQKTYTEKEAKQLASKNLKKYINDLEEKGIQITGKNVIIERTRKKYVVKGTISTIKSIVSYQPTKIIEQSSEERQLTDESD